MKINLRVPSYKDIIFRKNWLEDPITMEYNAGYDLDVQGYSKIDGTITLTDEQLKSWVNNWINNPTRFFAFVYLDNEKDPVGEVYYYLKDNTYGTGIMIDSKYRKKELQF